MSSFLTPGRNGASTPTSEIPSLTEDADPPQSRAPIASGPSGRLSPDHAVTDGLETAPRNMSLTINGAGTWALAVNGPDIRNGVGFRGRVDRGAEVLEGNAFHRVL